MSKGRHVRHIDLKQCLPSKEGLLKFGKRAATVGLIGAAAVLGTKYMADAIGSPAASTFGENVSQIDDRFMDMGKGIVLYAGAMLTGLASAAWHIRNRHDPREEGLGMLVRTEGQVPLVDEVPMAVEPASVQPVSYELRTPTGTLIDDDQVFAAQLRAYELSLAGQAA